MSDKGLNVLSLFDGMSCGQIALGRAGIKVDNYFAAEIDKYAVTVTQANYPDTKQMGDVTKVKASDLPKIDLLIGGSPCQGFSFAGKQLNFDDPRSMLFFEYVRLLEEIRKRNPNVLFLMENVVMKKEYQNVISEYLGVKPIKINSALVSAQNRNRLYWTNIPDVGQPEDKGVLLGEILLPKDRSDLEDHLLSKKAIAYMDRLRNGKPRWEYHTNPLDGKAACLTANMYKGVPYGVLVIPEERYPITVRATVQKNAEHTTNGKCPTITAAAGIGGGNVPLYADNKTADSFKGKYINGVERKKFRKLHPIECERLQTVPDNYTNHVSNTQRYKMLGNGWTVDVIAHIFKNLDLL